jgi:hypothetical protein
MIRTEAHILDMTAQDIADTMPVIAHEIDEWQRFGRGTESENIKQICIAKADALSQRYNELENRKNYLK